MKRKIVLLGATGSIGDSTLEVVRANPDRLEIVGIAANKNWKKLAEIAREFSVPHVAISDEAAFEAGKGAFGGAKLYKGARGLEEISTLDCFDTLVAAVVGTDALIPTMSAIKCKKDIALANKEILVMSGKFMMEAARQNGVKMLPLDSEHNAIFQCIQGERKEDIQNLIITASGGMFRDYTFDQMQKIRPEDAMKHPNWNMGVKVTIDSSTLANKGLEVIEAKWLFDVSPEQIEVVVHRQSIVHSMVRFKDGSILAHMAPPSMTFPIEHSLLVPGRGRQILPSVDFTKRLNLDFAPPDTSRFPCLRHAFDALKAGGTATAVFNASNEVAVANFIKGKISWLDIPKVVGAALEQIDCSAVNSIEELLQRDAFARIKSAEIAEKLCGK
ncbi:MAG: 1-deoxy-D-xylulose-5-phosphate reductoisomerase [Opitutales bacterium]|nr:1-deoxy-D-xylulose-5-phosphate reductoisomerase [Opitutales bacterium]